MKVLFVFPTREEAAYLLSSKGPFERKTVEDEGGILPYYYKNSEDFCWEVVITGVGLPQAATKLQRTLAQRNEHYDYALVVGVAGGLSQKEQRGTLYSVGRLFLHDAKPLTLGEGVCLATIDSPLRDDQDPRTGVLIEQGVELVDLESYGLITVLQESGCTSSIYCYRVVSDVVGDGKELISLEGMSQGIKKILEELHQKNLQTKNNMLT